MVWPATVVENLRREERVGMRRLAMVGADDPDTWATVQRTLLSIRSAIADFACLPRRPGSPMIRPPKNAVRTDEILIPGAADGLQNAQPPLAPSPIVGDPTAGSHAV